MNYKGTREAAAAAVTELAADDKRIVFVSADSLKAMRATEFAELYPERYVECGISEQGAVDTAAGLAACGKVPFVGTYAGFLTMRACEQMRTFVAYPNLNVKFIGINAGLIGGEREGVTHQFYEDVGILSSMANITILTPADAEQIHEAVKAAAQIEGPVYIRAGSGRESDVYPAGAPFSLDGFAVLRSFGKRALLLSSGYVLSRALKAAELLHEKGIDITAADVTIINNRKPEKLLELLAQYPCILTVEDHNVNGGLGSFISTLVCEHCPRPVQRIGLRDTFGESGAADALADAYGFSAQAIAERVEHVLEEL